MKFGNNKSVKLIYSFRLILSLDEIVKEIFTVEVMSVMTWSRDLVT